jgi:ubiquinone/menaquinone biosynthesis C-methylase UbiE
MSQRTATEYFDFIASLGYTKHHGSLTATRELVRLCHIEPDSYVLDVGCGVGATPSLLAREVGCRVMGVDLLEKMVEHSRQRAREDGVEHLTDFRAADARDLPFDDDTFDGVISESVNVFFPDKRQAASEYVRVTRPGGYVGMTEMTWLQPPTQQMEESFVRMAYAHVLDVEGWTEVLRASGLADVVGTGSQIDVKTESKTRIQRYGWRRILRGLLNATKLMARDRRARQFVSDGSGALSKDMLHIVGYGVYAGRKPEAP